MLNIYNIVLRDVVPKHGDLVYYFSRQDLKYTGALGVIVGTNDDGKHLVMWCLRGKQMSFDLHEPASLCVLAQGDVRRDDLEDVPQTHQPRDAAFFLHKR